MKRCPCKYCRLGPNKVRITVNLEPDVWTAVRLLAAHQDISVSAVIRHALAEYLERYK